jgi:adenylate cyclase
MMNLWLRKGKRIAPLWLARLLIGFLACFLTVSIEWLRPGFVVSLDEALRDTALQLQAMTQPEDRLVVVDINEEALSYIGPWPWSRQHVADLVEILLSTYGARAVGLDIVFTEPGDIQGNARLASLAANAPLALAQIFDFTPRSSSITQGQLAGGLPSPKPEQGAMNAYGYIANHAELSGARCLGNIGYQPDADGVLRRLPARTRFQGKDYPHLASALLTCGNPSTLVTHGDSKGMWRVPYSHAQSAYTVISATDILRESAPKTLITGRYVLVGSSALGLGDRVSTPLASISAGVMVHAASLTGLLDLAEGRAQGPWSARLLLLMWSALSIGLAVYFISRLPAWGGLLLILGLVVSWLGVAFALIARQAEWSVTAPLWAYFFLLVVAVPHEWWQTQRKSRRLMATFSHYVAQPVLDEIVRLGLQHSLTPTLRDVTVLIADMEGYTLATSSMSLGDAATLTKDFLACLTRPVLQGHGTLDRYSGDGLVAFWGAPLLCPDQADRAVTAALAILNEVREFNTQRQCAGFLPVQVRIGIESGKALVGDLGTAFRSTYTAVGDCINFASRLEFAARDLPTQLVIGAVANALLKKHATQSLGTITLRGTQTTIEIFTV